MYLSSLLTVFFGFLLLKSVVGLTKEQEKKVFDTISKDVNGFHANFSERLNDMKEFVQANESSATDMEIDYLLFTPNNPDTPFYLERTTDSLDKSHFNPALDTKIFVHGVFFSLDFPSDVKFETKDAILDIGDYNVIVMNFTKYMKSLLSEDIKNGFLVGKNLVATINFLKENTGISAEKFHLIGHSLGGHIAGYAGSQVPNLGRITGLDASGPIIDKFPAEYRLSPKSANFVDAIHTSAAKDFTKGQGIYYRVGHQDFYVNGGNNQPGCENGDTFTTEGLQKIKIQSPIGTLICNHQRSEFLFLASVSDCTFVGMQCKSYGEYKSGHCSVSDSSSAVMGFHAQKYSEEPAKYKFYVDTNSQYPFCKH